VQHGTKCYKSMRDPIHSICLLTIVLMALPGRSPAQTPSTPQADSFAGKPRVAIISDMGNEPDDQMSFVRLLVYSNQFDLEAMVATTSTWQRTATHPETMHNLIHAYSQVRDNLLLNASGWPTAEDLDAHVFTGQPGYGLASTGEGKSSPGSKALVQAIERDDPRPLWVCIWGGANTLAQALRDLRAASSQETTDRLVSRVRVYSISDQDDAGPWIRREFPTLTYVVSPSRPNGEEYYSATWTGISGDLFYRNGEGADTSVVTNEWLDANIRSKGPLGKVYPRFLFIMEGDTPSFLGLIDNGLNAYRRPDWGGWGGRYVYLQPYGEQHAIWSQGGDAFTRRTSQDLVKGSDGRTYVSDQASIWRWRDAIQNDFAARMDWTIKDFAHANHNPAVVVNGKGGTAPVELSANPGDEVALDANGTTDPDTGQALTYSWFVYPEAGVSGTHGADVELTNGEGPTTKVKIKSACAQTWLPIPCHSAGVAHIIVAVTDNGSPTLTSYRRIILSVNADSRPPAAK
jgi:hypothetical protein